ncbi:MAG TPA: hypothetical protein VFS20_24055 [Longimicrobium sp.]|nr:hypothetical protein [Longimicrobium sp.]
MKLHLEQRTRASAAEARRAPLRRWILAACAAAALTVGGVNAQPASVTLHPRVLLRDRVLEADTSPRSWGRRSWGVQVTRDPRGRLYVGVYAPGRAWWWHATPTTFARCT